MSGIFHASRREFLKAAGIGSAALMMGGTASAYSMLANRVPSYLRNYKSQYRDDPRAAATEWFRDARFGLFMHFGLYSIVGMGEWVQLRQKIPVAEYVTLTERFGAENFDPDFITDLALDANMKYVNITSRHHDSFSLFHTKYSDYNVMNTPAKRDLIAELSEACEQKGLGLFLYYSYAADWHHPYFYSRDLGWNNARPDYEHPQPEYKFESKEDFQKYIDFAHGQIEELLTNYGSLAGVWLDPIMGYYMAPDLFPIEDTYALIRSKQPQVLISFKQGANGDEDFVAPERDPRAHPRGGEVAEIAWERNQGKPIEICDTLQPRTWGYDMRDGQQHKTADYVMKMLDHAKSVNANLLLNTGPLHDGSIYPQDVKTLREVGIRLRKA